MSGAGPAPPPALDLGLPANDAVSQEQEPRLKYERFGCDVPIILQRQAATRLCVSDKVLALGTHNGTVHLLDYDGNEIKSYREHGGAVTDLSFDAQAENLASCAADGSLVIYGLYSEEMQRFKFRHPVTTVCLDPRYARRKTREFVYGTATGALVLCSKGWLGNTETVLFQGRGSVHVVRMAGTLLAWATDTGVRVYDTSNHSRLGKVDRPAACAPARAGAPCCLRWVGQRELLIGWGSTVMVVAIVPPAAAAAGTAAGTAAAALGGLSSAAAASSTGISSTAAGAGGSPWTPPSAAGIVPVPGNAGVPRWSLHTVASFQVEGYTVAGVAAFGAQLAVLAWAPVAAGSDRAEGGSGSDGGGCEDNSGDKVVGNGSQGGSRPGSAASWRSRSIRERHAAVEPPAGGTIASESAIGSDSGSDGDDLDAAGAMASPRDQHGSNVKVTPPQPPAALKVLSRSGKELFSDALNIQGIDLAEPGRCQVQMEAFYAPEGAGRDGVVLPGATPSGNGYSGSGTGSAASSVPATPRDAAPPRSPSPATEHGTPGRPPPLPANAAPAAEPPQPYKWWRDGAEPLYFLLSDGDVVLGRPREGRDRVAWLAGRRRFAEALSVAETDPEVKEDMRAALAERYLQFLLDQGRFQEAAELTPRALRGDGAAWERWAYEFGLRRQLAVLAPVLPTVDPRLEGEVYDMALGALLASPQDHPQLLSLVESWPHGSYDAAALLTAVLSRLRISPAAATAAASSPSARALLQATATLHSQLGEHGAALQTYLDLRLPLAFDYLQKYALLVLAGPHAAALMEVDEVRATKLLVENWEETAPAQVVASLQAAAAEEEKQQAKQAAAVLRQEAPSPAREEEGPATAAAPATDAAAASPVEAERWRCRLHHYLDWLFRRDSAAAAPFAALQVELFASCDPPRLLHFLTVCPSYPLDRALEVCEAAGLVREAVYVLGRMGAADRALRLIVGQLRDVEGAVAFVKEQRDAELWELLISLALGDASLAGALLDHAGGYVDPLRVVGAIPPGMPIDHLQQRLVRIITDFRAHMSLQQGCNAVLRADCVQLAERLYRLLRRALRRLHLRTVAAGGLCKWTRYDAQSGEEVPEEAGRVPGPLPLQSLQQSRETGVAALLQRSPTPGTSSSSSVAGPSTPRHQQQREGEEGEQAGDLQQQQQRVWVGFLPGSGPVGQRERHTSMSPLASSPGGYPAQGAARQRQRA